MRAPRLTHNLWGGNVVVSGCTLGDPAGQVIGWHGHSTDILLRGHARWGAPKGDAVGHEGGWHKRSCHPCGDTWVCQAVIAGIAQQHMHNQKEIKANHKPERLFLGASRQNGAMFLDLHIRESACSDWASHAHVSAAHPMPMDHRIDGFMKPGLSWTNIST